MGGGKTVHHARQRVGALLESRQASQGARRRAEVFQAIQVEQNRANADPFELARGGDVRAGVVEDHEIGVPRRHRFDVRRHPVADARNG